jgi:hypothetical protein
MMNSSSINPRSMAKTVSFNAAKAFSLTKKYSTFTLIRVQKIEDCFHSNLASFIRILPPHYLSGRGEGDFFSGA